MPAPISWSQKPGVAEVRAFVLPTSVADLASFPLDIPPAAVTPTDEPPPPPTGPDGATTGTGFRDRDIRHAIRDALLATSIFDTVLLGNIEDDYTHFGIEARHVVIDEAGQDVRYMWDTNEIDNLVVDSHVKLSFVTQSEDPLRRDENIELMMDAAYNTMIGISWLGVTMPAFSSFGKPFKFPKVKPPQRQVDITYTYRYMPGSSFGTAE